MKRLILLSATLLTLTARAPAQPATGMPIPLLNQLDSIMQTNMTTYNTKGGVLGVMRNGVIVYQRGFGWKDAGNTVPMRHDTPMRIASVTKPVTAAAIQQLYANGTLNTTDRVFNLGQPGGGLLNLAPFPSLTDTNYGLITVQDLLSHTAGLPWNQTSNPVEPMFREIVIADAFNNAGQPSPYPPGRQRTVRWMMGNRPLIATPGTNQYFYSNEGFMVLGLIIEQETGQDWFSYVRSHVLAPLPWTPLADIVSGRSFAVDQDPREPLYVTSATGPNVFDPDVNVNKAYGGYHHEQHVSSGALVTNTTTLLHIAEMYYINGENAGAGLSTTYGLPTNGVRSNRFHNGSLFGTESWLEQRNDGINYAFILNDSSPNFAAATAIRNQLDALFDSNTLSWPTQGVDGQWADFANGQAGDGSYENPWNNFGTALSSSPNEASVNVKPGNSSWTGTITQEIRLRAPLGTARIGT